MSSEYVIKKRARESEARIFLGRHEIAKIIKHEGFTFRLIRHKDKQEWILSNMVDGERRPFSYAVLKVIQKTSRDRRKEIQAGEEVFVVREQLFKYNGKFYMLASHPEGKSWTDYVNSSIRYVSRLDSFPYSNLSDIDHEHYKLRHKVKRFRGTPVGEATGLGQDEGGHHLRLDNDLAEVGLFIAAISYLLYASG